MLDGLPTDVDELIYAVGGVLLHPVTAFELLGEPEPADQGAGELMMTRMLERLHAIDPAPLSVPRPVAKRLRVNCRGFAMLFVTVLRHQGVPVRKRVGFDCGGDIHEVAEYWHEGRQRWVLVDPDPASREPLRAFLRRRGHAGRQEAVDPHTLAWLDQAAELTGSVDARFDELRAFYARSAYGSAVRARLARLVG